MGQLNGTRVLVTGVSGYIAGHCVRELFEHGYVVRGTVRGPASEAKLAPLRELADRVGGSLEIVYADLAADDGWQAAVADCAYVLHVASPFPAGPPDHEDDLVVPAVEGTRRVLRACADSGSVRRVVLTSSIAAVSGGYGPESGVRTEADWSNLDRSDAYQKSKTLAERAAWEFVSELPDGKRFELVAINPGVCLGPLLGSEPNTSLESVRKLLSREMPGVLQLGFAIVDVRDVALAHRLAMERPEAVGKRYICAGESVSMKRMAELLAEEFGPAGYRVPTRELPYWMGWLAARFDKTVRLVLAYVGQEDLVSAERAERELGWSMRPVRETLVDTGYSLIEHELVPAPQQASARARSGS